MLQMNLVSYYLIALALQLNSCKSLYDRTSFVKSPASGEASNHPWTYVYGFTDADSKRPEGISHIIVLMTSKTKNACPDASERGRDARELIIGIDGKLGEMKIGGKSGKYETSEDLFSYTKSERQGSAAFFDPKGPPSKQYQFATSGKIKITKISKTFIEGFILAKVNPDNFANGRFKAKICKWGQLN